jgi:predicted DNA-binding transcriptional regulator AlpA
VDEPSPAEQMEVQTPCCTSLIEAERGCTPKTGRRSNMQPIRPPPMRRSTTLLIQPAMRLGLSRTEAAEYVGVSPSLFDELVADGRMPPAKAINARRVWHRAAIERAFLELPNATETTNRNDPWASARA